MAWTGVSTFERIERISSSLFVELRPLYKKAFAHVTTELADSREQFARMVADLCFVGWNDPLEGGWLPAFVGAVEDEDRGTWIDRVNRRLGQLEEDGIQEVWSKWLRAYWTDRIHGKPIPMSAREAGRMVQWIFNLEPVLYEVVDLIIEQPAPSIDHSVFLLRLRKSEISTHQPQTIAQFLLYLLGNREGIPLYDCGYVRDVIEQLAASNKVENTLMSRLLERGIELGCLNSSDKQRLL